MLHDGKREHPFLQIPIVFGIGLHDVDMGPANRTSDSAKSFTSFIATCQRNDFLGKLKCCHFYNILITTDLSNKEEEIVAMVFRHIDACISFSTSGTIRILSTCVTYMYMCSMCITVDHVLCVYILIKMSGHFKTCLCKHM